MKAVWRGLNAALRLRNLPFLTVLVATVCPGLIVMKGPHQRWVVLATLAIPVIWVVRWRKTGFLFGVLFLWFSLFAMSLDSLGPGQVDNMFSTLTVVFGWLFALLWLGLASLIAVAVSDGPRVWRRLVAIEKQWPAVAEPPRRTRSFWRVAGALLACVAAVMILKACWVYRPRHPQYVAIEAIEAAAGGVVELGRPRPFGPVVRVRRGYGTKIGDTEMKYLAEFEHLKELDLDEAHVSDAGLQYIRGLREIEKLNLSGTRITGDGLANLKGMTKIKQLHLGRTQINDAGLVNIEGMTELCELDLGETAITDAGLAHLAGLSNLRFLDLYRCRQIADAGLVHLQKLRDLRRLNVSQSQITDSGLLHLKGLSQLEHLDLTRTKVTKEGVEDLQKSLPQAHVRYGTDRISPARTRQQDPTERGTYRAGALQTQPGRGRGATLRPARFGVCSVALGCA